RIGRTLRALEATFDDLRVVTSPAVLANSGGGLRGGSWAVRARKFSVQGYTVVRGVTLTGGGTSRLVFHVSGSKAAHGTVTLRTGGRMRGTLGGHKISVTLCPRDPVSKRPGRTAQAPPRPVVGIVDTSRSHSASVGHIAERRQERRRG